MMSKERLRIYLTGVGGQGTLTVTTLLSRTALDEGIQVVSGEIHGMAQRGGVVESTVLLGGFLSPTISHGQADIILSFEALETLRALPYLAPGGAVFSATDFVPPPGVSSGKESLPEFESIRKAVLEATGRAWFVPIRAIGLEAGSLQSGNSAMLGALCASGLVPFDLAALKAAIEKYMPAKVRDANLAAAEKGAASASSA